MCDKIKFKNREIAANEAAKIKKYSKKIFKAYFCKLCEHWHHASTGKSKRKRMKKESQKTRQWWVKRLKGLSL